MPVQLLLWIVTTVIGWLLTPKPPVPDPGKVEIPTVEEGRKVGILFGSRWIKGPHVYWWGDVRNTKIYSDEGKKG